MEGVNKDVSNDPRVTLSSAPGAVGVDADRPADGAGDGNAGAALTRPKYAYVRNMIRSITHDRDRTVHEHAFYDVVDNDTGATIAHDVRYANAQLIVEALNGRGER